MSNTKFVYQTSDLEKFSTLQGNRIVNPQHVDRLCKSIKSNGMLLNPIIVNELHQVIDGQHRLAAAKKAKSAIWYIVAEGYKVTEVHTLNQNQKNWTIKDFVDGYAKQGMDEYIKLKEFIEKNNQFPVTACLAIANGGDAGRAEYLREGKFTFKNKDAQDWVDRIFKLKDVHESWNRRSVITAFCTLFKKEKFDFNRFLKKLKRNPKKLSIGASRKQLIIEIEEIYNYYSQKPVNLRF